MRSPRSLFICALLALVGCQDPAPGDEADTSGSTGEATTGEATSSGGEASYFDDCGDGPPDAACYAEKRDPGSESIALAEAIARRHMTVRPAPEQPWGWEEAVFMFSLTELHRVTGDPQYQDHYRAWIDRHIEQGYTIDSSDNCAPAALAVILYMETGDVRYRAVVEDALRYLRDEAIRSEEGGISHFGGIEFFSATLWVDSLFMFGNVMTRWGEFTDDAALLAEYGDQFRIFSEVLQADGGLYRHADAWLNLDPSLYWGRGNGWAHVAGHDYLRVRTLRGETDETVAAAMRAQNAAITASQDPSGLWWTVLNRPGETYLETSAAALFAYGLARGFRYGLVDADALPTVERALAGVRAKIVEDEQGLPVVTGISGPTMPGDLPHYAMIPLEDDKGYGVGAVILALIETSGLPAAR